MTEDIENNAPPPIKTIWVPTAQAFGDKARMRALGLVKKKRVTQNGRQRIVESYPPTLQQILTKWLFKGYFAQSIFPCENGADQLIAAILVREPDAVVDDITNSPPDEAAVTPLSELPEPEIGDDDADDDDYDPDTDDDFVGGSLVRDYDGTDRG